MTWSTSKLKLEKLKIHASETAWVGGAIDFNVDNNTTIDDLFSQIKDLIPQRGLSEEVSVVLDLI
jgi:hypothetical protein